MTDLSPAAQAVLDAYLNAPLDVDFQMANRLGIAAAIHAAAAHLGSCNSSTELIRIATELEGQ